MASSTISQIAEDLDMAKSGPESRLSMSSISRVPLAGVTAFALGMTLGMAEGSRSAGLQFRAEHSHRMPTSSPGWYLYHKTKSYRSAQAGLKEGLKMGGRLGFWTALAFTLESTIDRCRGQSDALSTVTASLTTAGVFSAWNRFSLPTAARTARYGLMFGLAYGGIQDALSLIRGRRVGYVDFVRRRVSSLRTAATQKQT